MCIRENVDRLAFADRNLFSQICEMLLKVADNAETLCNLNNIALESASMVGHFETKT
jgi:hypothetical protein